MKGEDMRRRLSTVLAAFASSLLLLLPASALAATPANDDVTAATVISAPPFADTVDTSAATAAPGDLDCSGLEDTHTVWYTITPTTDMLLGLLTEPQFAAEVSTSVASGSPGSLSFLQCSFATSQTLDAKAGTTYYIQLASAGADPGGPIRFGVVQVEPVTVTLGLDPTGRIDDGVITVGGTLRCSRQLPSGSEVVVQGTLTQGSATGWLVPFHSGVGCPVTPLRWQTTVQVLAGSFVRGRAVLTATAFACDSFTCAPNDTESARIRLR
jgi:hypothetical protein